MYPKPEFGHSSVPYRKSIKYTSMSHTVAPADMFLQFDVVYFEPVPHVQSVIPLAKGCIE